MKEAMAAALAKGENFSHFGPEANLFDKLAELFQTYGETGTARSATTSTPSRRPPSTTAASAPASSRASSPPGSRSPPAPTCSSTKACTAA